MPFFFRFHSDDNLGQGLGPMYAQPSYDNKAPIKISVDSGHLGPAKPIIGPLMKGTADSLHNAHTLGDFASEASKQFPNIDSSGNSYSRYTSVTAKDPLLKVNWDFLTNKEKNTCPWVQMIVDKSFWVSRFEIPLTAARAATEGPGVLEEEYTIQGDIRQYLVGVMRNPLRGKVTSGGSLYPTNLPSWGDARIVANAKRVA